MNIALAKNINTDFADGRARNKSSRWSKEEDDLLISYMLKGYSAQHTSRRIPSRTKGSCAYRTSLLPKATAVETRNQLRFVRRPHASWKMVEVILQVSAGKNLLLERAVMSLYVSKTVTNNCADSREL